MSETQLAQNRKAKLYVPAADCLKLHLIVDARLHRFDLALFGEDGCHGLVKTISDVKTDIAIIKASTSLLRQILVPVISSLITAGLMYVMLRG